MWVYIVSAKVGLKYPRIIVMDDCGLLGVCVNLSTVQKHQVL